MLFLVVAVFLPGSLEWCSRADPAWGGIVGLLAMLWMVVGLAM